MAKFHAPQLSSGLAPLFEGSAYKGEQGNLTSLLDRRSHHALMTGARAGLAAWADLAIFCDVASKQVCLLVVNGQRFVCAELTKFGLGKEAAFAATFLSPFGSSIFSHLLLQFWLIQRPDITRQIF